MTVLTETLKAMTSSTLPTAMRELKHFSLPNGLNLTVSKTSYSDHSNEQWYTPYITFKRHSKEPWSKLPLDIVRPLKIVFRPTIFLPSLAYAIAFSYSNVLLTIEIPGLLGRKENLNAQQIGLQFIAAIIGSILGEPIAGWGSDQFSMFISCFPNISVHPYSLLRSFLQ